MWIVRVARTRPYTFILLALLILMLSPLVILRTRNDIFPSVNIPAIAVARAAGIAGGEAASAPLRKIAELELPGPAGKRFDYLTIDEDDNYLLSAHLGAGLLHAVDLRTNAVVKTVRDVPGVEGVAYIAEGRKVYTANWGENKIGVVDLARMSVIKRLPTEEKPDGIAYAAPFHKAYVSNERAKAESIIDVRTDTIVKVLRFDSETGVPQYDPVARKIYVNLQDQNILAVIDPATDAVVGRYPVQGCRGNHGMAVDPRPHRLYAPAEQDRGRPASKMFVFEAVTN